MNNNERMRHYARMAAESLREALVSDMTEVERHFRTEHWRAEMRHWIGKATGRYGCDVVLPKTIPDLLPILDRLSAEPLATAAD